MKRRFGKVTVELVEGDITSMETDAIVNPANSELAHGGGVAGAILRAGGDIIREESETWILARGEVPVGSVAITSGGSLPARYVIHAVGPRLGEGDEDEKLKKATLSSLATADKHGLESIAFPAISTGIFGFPMDRCAEIMITAVVDYIQKETKLKRIVFCLWGREAFNLFKNVLSAM